MAVRSAVHSYLRCTSDIFVVELAKLDDVCGGFGVDRVSNVQGL